jgi:hypothetical protein
VLVRPDVGGVGNRGFVVGVASHELQDPVEDLGRIPARKFGVNGLPGAEALGKVAPGNARLRNVEDRIHEGPIGEFGRTGFAAALGRQQRLNPLPFFVGQLVTSHLQT